MRYETHVDIVQNLWQYVKSKYARIQSSPFKEKTGWEKAGQHPPLTGKESPAVPQSQT